jgi:2-dehydropantoate 2-reductase
VRGLLDVGRYPGGANEIDAALAQAFTDAQFASEVRDDIMAHKRTKLLSNLSNGLDAMLGDRASPLSDAAMQEAQRVYEAAGLALVPSVETDPRRKQMARGEIRGMKRTGGSTWQSVARGATEIETDYLNGEIALLGRLHGIATPVNERLQRLAAKFVREGRAPGSLTLAELESWDA